MLHVRVMEASREVARVPLDGDIVKIGSIASAQIRLEGRGVSRLHAVLEVEGDEATVIDLGSESGTSVNDSRVSKVAVHAGDRIGIGPFTLHVELAAAERPLPPPTIDPVARPAHGPKCPWCGGNLGRAYSTGGPYRGVALAARRCKACGLTMVEGRDVAGYFDLSGNPDKRALLERKREKMRTRCGSCDGPLEQITLSASSAWVTIEECQQCRQIVLEDGEVDSLRALIAEAAGLTSK